MVAYLLIGVAVIAEVFGDSMMKLSNGFQRKLPLVGTVVGYGIAFYLIAQALEHLPLGPVYAAWTGLGIALTAVVGAVVWKEGFNVKKALGLAAIIGGVTFDGGKGTIGGAFLGCLLMGVISNAMDILGVDTNVQTIITGAIIVGAVVLSNINNIKKK